MSPFRERALATAVTTNRQLNPASCGQDDLSRAGDGLQLYRLSVDQYHSMLDLGVIHSGEPIELLEGLLVEKRPIEPPPDDPVVEGEVLPIFRLRAPAVHKLRDSGIIPADEPVEFIEGLLVCTMVRRPPHDTALGLIQDELTRRLPEDWILRIQSAVELTDGEPEPDAAVVRGGRREFAKRHPIAEECGLVIEVAEASLSLDRGLKLRSYARHSIAEYWIVNLVDQQVEVYANPSGLVSRPAYRERNDYRQGQSIPFHLAGRPLGDISVADVLP